MLGTTEPYGLNMRIHLGAMLLAGAILLPLPLVDFYRRRDVESAILALWVFGTVVFTVYVNHLINARTLLPAAPALAILVARNLPPPKPGAGRWRLATLLPLAAGLVFSVWVSLGDYAVAENGRFSARRAAERANSEGVDLYYSGLWGFQYYAQLERARVFTVEDLGWDEGFRIRMQHGDLLVVSSDGREKWRSPPEGFVLEEALAYPNRFGVATYHPADETGFYSHLAGIVPYKFGLRGREEYGLFRWTGPDYVSAKAAP
jgi:hypothetical protein